MITTGWVSATSDIILEPKKTFSGLIDAKGWSWIPLLLSSVIMIASLQLYFSTVDPDYFIENQIAALGPDITAQERDVARASLQDMHSGQTVISMVGSIVTLLFFTGLTSVWFYLVSKPYENKDYQYKDWFGFTMWTNMPSVILYLGVVLLILLSDTNEIPLSIFNYSSFNQLLLGLEPGDAFYTLTETINLFMLWSIALSAIGLQIWTKMQLTTASVVAALPIVLVFGIWAVVVSQ
jgi:hypothetical protein